jgi:hypothetical protein
MDLAIEGWNPGIFCRLAWEGQDKRLATLRLTIS